jgi:hypothetical protein
MSDSDSSDSSDDEDEKIEQEVAALTETLKSFPNHYDSHVALIAAQRKAGDLGAVRAARESMADTFPLTAELWTAWLQDEQRLASTKSERNGVLQLYERAVEDYLSTQLWLAYCEYAEEMYREESNDGGTADAEQVRELYEKAIAAVGLHFAQAGAVWNAYRNFEKQVAADGSMDKVNGLFGRQARIPMDGLGSVWAEWEDFGGDGAHSSLAKEHAVAKRAADARAKFENAVLDEQSAAMPGPTQIEPWLSYAQYEIKKGNHTARTVCVFERAVSSWPLSVELWQAYLSFANQKQRDGPLTLRIYRRAVRNVLWSASLWCGYLQAAEEYNQDSESIFTIYTQALGAQLAAASEYTQIHLTYCEYLRRALGLAAKEAESNGSQSRLDEVASAAMTLRTVFEGAASHLTAHAAANPDPEQCLVCAPAFH